MKIDIMSLIIGAVLGGAAVVFTAAVSVAKDRIEEKKEGKET